MWSRYGGLLALSFILHAGLVWLVLHQMRTPPIEAPPPSVPVRMVSPLEVGDQPPARAARPIKPKARRPRAAIPLSKLLALSPGAPTRSALNVDGTAG